VKTLPGPIGDEVRRELARFGPEAGLGELVAAWPEAVGPGVAANAWPARIARDGTLHVATASSAWAFELTQLAETVVRRLRERLGEQAPTHLRFAVGPLPEGGPEAVEEVRSSGPKMTPEYTAQGRRIASEIEDPELRETVARAAAASLAITGTDRSI
jgi:predicted nucleic acid-binding Zn ribbon protein